MKSESEEMSVAIRSFKATLRAARKARSVFFWLSVETADHVDDALDHRGGNLAQHQQMHADGQMLDALARKWVRDNPGKARAELAKVEASR